MSTMIDLRYGLRMLAKNPGFTAVAVLTLALGIGANTAIFSVMNTVMLRYLPVPDPQQLVYLRVEGRPEGTHETGDDSRTFSEATFEQLRTQRRVFSALMAFVPLGEIGVPVRYGEQPEVVHGDMVSGNFFSGRGVEPTRGRIFALHEETEHAQVTVLSYAYWPQSVGAWPNALHPRDSVHYHRYRRPRLLGRRAGSADRPLDSPAEPARPERLGPIGA